MKGKKAQAIEQLGTVMVTLVAMAILLVATFLIIGGIEEETIDQQTTTTTVTNESMTWTNNTFVAFGNQDILMPGTIACTTVYNGTSVLIESGNYTCNDHGFRLIDSGDGDNWDTIVNLSYTYKIRTEAYNSTHTIADAIQTVPTYLSVIVIAFVGAIMIGLVTYFRNQY